MNRRRFVRSAVACSTILAGCSGAGSDPATETTDATTDRATPTSSRTEAPTDTETSTAGPDTVFVGPEGDDSNPGTEDEPVASITRAANDVAEPGDTVHVLPGEYVEHVRLSQSGTADAPITLTGPPDAVLRPERGGHLPIAIRGNHVHLTGLTITGLLDPEAPEDPDSYFDGKLIGASAIDLRPEGVEYLEGLVISPHRLGNAGQSLMNFTKIRDSEIGGFRVIGPAGANWILDDTPGHNGEIVYLGTAPGNVQRRDDLDDYDRTRNVRVHHIDNSEGHPHAELVDCKAGVENVVVEYCTDGGGSQSHDSPYTRSVSLDGVGCTVRWNFIQDVVGNGVRIGPQDLLNDSAEYAVDEEPQTELERRFGTGHAIYGNVITGCTVDAIRFLRESRTPGRDSNPLPEDQRAICGNLHDGYSHGDPDEPCPADLPAGDGVGHLGGDSPWAGAPPTRADVFERSATYQHLDVTVGADTFQTNSPIEIPVTIENTSGSPAEVEILFGVFSDVLATETVTVPADGTERVTITHDGLSIPAEYKLTRNGQKVEGILVLDDDRS